MDHIIQLKIIYFKYRWAILSVNILSNTKLSIHNIIRFELEIIRLEYYQQLKNMAFTQLMFTWYCSCSAATRYLIVILIVTWQ